MKIKNLKSRITMEHKIFFIALVLSNCFLATPSLECKEEPQQSVMSHIPEKTKKESNLQTMREKLKYKGMPPDIFTAIPAKLIPWFEKMEIAKSERDSEEILSEMLEANSKLIDKAFVTVKIRVTNKKNEAVAGAKVQLNELRDSNSEYFDDQFVGTELKKMLTTDENGKCSYDKIQGFNFYRLIMALGNSGYFHHNFNAIVKAKGYKPQTVTFITVNKRILAMAYRTLLISQLMRERNGEKLLKVHEKYSIPKEWTTDEIELNIVLEEADARKSVRVEEKQDSESSN